MNILSRNIIKKRVARSDLIYSRGEKIFSLGNYSLVEADKKNGSFSYSFDGSGLLL